MIDIHSHIIHGVDDGPADIETSLEMIRKAAEIGIETIVATPHFWYPRYINENVDARFKELKDCVKKNNIDINIMLGNEVYLNDYSFKSILEGKVNSIGDEYLLIELPESGYYNSHEIMLYELQLKGYKIVLAHVERFKYLIKNRELIDHLKNNDILFQMNASYIVSLTSRRKALKLLKNGIIDVISSDCHGISWRPNLMGEAWQIVSKKLGEEKARDLFYNNAKNIII